MSPVLKDAADVANSNLNPLTNRYPKGTTESIAYQSIVIPDDLEESINLNGKSH
jgi:hypothetical protein